MPWKWVPRSRDELRERSDLPDGGPPCGWPSPFRSPPPARGRLRRRWRTEEANARTGWRGGPAAGRLPRAGHAHRHDGLPGGGELRHDGRARGLDLRAVRAVVAEQRVAFPAGGV